jgi:NitT/TauT family transport system permease protein
MTVDTEMSAAVERTPAAAATPPTRRRWRADWVALVGSLVVFLAFLGVWYLFSFVVLDEDRRWLLPPPHEVVRVAFFDAESLEQLLRALGLTAEVAMLGLALAIAIGMSIAILMSQAKWLEKSLYPYAVILQTIPILAMVPLIAYWFGFGFNARVLVCVLIALFPIINNTLFGLQSVEPGQHDLFRLHGAGRATRLWKLQLPAAMPAIFAGFRISAGLAVIGAVVGDFFFKQGEPGIGVLIDLYRSRIQSELLIAAVILASLLGVVVFWLFGFLSNRVVGRWHASGYDPAST